MNPRRAMTSLIAEGLSIPQIAGIGHCATSSVRLFLLGETIPKVVGQRFCIAAQTLRLLSLGPLRPQATFADLVVRHCR